MTPTSLDVALDVAGAARTRTTGWERFVHGLRGGLEQLETRDVRVQPVGPRWTARGRWTNLMTQLAWYSVGVRRETRSADVVHAPTYPPPRLDDRKVVWTVHDDLILGGHPEFARRGARVWVPLARRALEHVDVIVATSHTVARDLDGVGVAPAQTIVIHPGANDLPPPEEVQTAHDHRGRRATIPATFALVVGTLEARKRPEVAFEAARRVGLDVVFAGGVDASFDTGTLRVPGAHFLRPNDAQLSWLYANCGVFITTSVYEGLNMPLVEALRAGARTVASDIPIHREVGGRYVARYAPVGDVDETARSIRGTLGTDPPNGFTWPSWTDAAARYLGVYHEVAE